MEKQVFLRLKNINKIYPNGIQAVYDFNLDIYDQEFVVFVGPSGCGKSTTLRMIAGLEDVTSGDLYINQRLANNLSPKERDVAMVFQSYALYPHMNVYNNLAFGLRMRKVKEQVKGENGVALTEIDTQEITKIKKALLLIAKDITKVEKALADAHRLTDLEKKESILDQLSLLKQSLVEEQEKKQNELTYFTTTLVPVYQTRRYTKKEIDEKVRKAAKVLDIENYLFARPRELSGGQRQRVALGRSIVRNAKLFLMDEPLSNLDAKLRLSMRSEIVSLHRALEATTVYVTHDQIEAMTMADRIVVMKDGYIQQIGTPLDIYHQPTNVFVATFMGSPAMNTFLATYQNGSIKINDYDVTLNERKMANHDRFIQEQLDELNQHNKDLNRYIEAFNIELAMEKNRIKLNRIHKKIDSRNLELETNLKKIEQYHTFQLEKSHSLIVGIRPEDINISHTVSNGAVKAKVEFVELLGKEYYVHVLLNGVKTVASVSPKDKFEIGDTVFLSFNEDAIRIFDSISEVRID
jgi:ABC-type sugar transport system ATPase subunit